MASKLNQKTATKINKEIDSWMAQSYEVCKTLPVEILEQIIYTVTNSPTDENNNFDQDDEKENTVQTAISTSNGNNPDTADFPIKQNYMDNYKVSTPVQTTQTSEILDSQTLVQSYSKMSLNSSNHDAIYANTTQLSQEEPNETEGATEYWKTDTIRDKILNPQMFQNHVITTAYINSNFRDYEFLLNTSCPKSASETELLKNKLMMDPLLKQNALTYRYSRYPKCSYTIDCVTNCSNDLISVLCRLCPHKKWISLKHFKDHMSLAHGIISIDEDSDDIVVLPKPTALFEASPRGIKRYHSQCPKCNRWIRLGFPEVFAESTTQICASKDPILDYGPQDDNDELREKRGLFTNYFSHFMKCSNSDVD